MIVPDTNLFLYAYDANAREHRRARAWLQEAFSGSEIVGIAWQTISGFVRILTHPAVSGDRYSLEEAMAIVDEWLELPNVRILNPGQQHWTLLRKVLLSGNARGNLITDACLAALAMEFGGVLYSNDRDFARFPGLRWVNPLAKP